MIVGLLRTGGVITSAGLILAGTFAALMALDLVALFQVGFTVTLGLLVDAFLVRTFLVPSLGVPARRTQLVAFSQRDRMTSDAHRSVIGFFWAQLVKRDVAEILSDNVGYGS